MKRRSFITHLGLVGLGASVSSGFIVKKQLQKPVKLTILHTNDTHSNIDPFPSNHAKFPNMGGVARRFDLIQSIRSTEQHVLLLDAGDIFQGTPYFNRFGGVLEHRIMSELGYNAATMGNHDFDGGLGGFAKAQQSANFPFLCANYDFSNTLLEGLTQPHTIFKLAGIRVGVFGLGIDLNGLVPRVNIGETTYLDPIEMAQEQVKQLRRKKADLIICLSHLGYAYESDKISDVVLAQSTEGIDLIIGGHTHTFLEKPSEISNLSGKTTFINQVGWAGVQLGRMDFWFGADPTVQSAVIDVK